MEGVDDMAYESFDAYLFVTKSTPSEIYKDEFQELVNAEYENTTTLKEVLHNGNPITVRVVGKFNTETLSRRNDNYQKIIFKTPDYEVKIGDIFEFDDNVWICTDATHTTVSKSCTVTRSYHSITVNKKGISLEVPIIVEDAVRLYSIGQDRTNLLDLVSDEIIVYCPAKIDSTPIDIEVKDVYKIGRRFYKVLTVQDIIINGLLILKMQFYGQKPGDTHENIDENISEGYKIIISPSDPTIIKGKSKTFVATVSNDGVEDTEVEVVWYVGNKDGSNESYCTYSVDNRTCHITASNKTQHVSKIIVLRVVLKDNPEIFAEKTLTISRSI